MHDGHLDVDSSCGTEWFYANSAWIHSFYNIFDNMYEDSCCSCPSCPSFLLLFVVTELWPPVQMAFLSH